MPRKTKTKQKPRAKENSGERVFSGNVDEILAEKIVSRTRENTQKRNSDDQSNENTQAETPTSLRRQFRPFVVLSVVAGLLLLCIGLAGQAGKKRSRRR